MSEYTGRRCIKCDHPCNDYKCGNCGAINPTTEYWIAFGLVLAVIGFVMYLVLNI